MKKKETPEIILYQAPNGAIEFARDSDRETLWASLDQIASVFGRDKSVISRHIKNIFKEEELDRQSTVAFFATVQKEGKRNIKRTIEHYNLDMILSIGYRVNSKVATEFRKWATKTLKRHMIEGYTIHKKLLEKNYTLFQSALADIQSISQNTLSSDDVLELIKTFSATWFSLDAFDAERFHSTKQTQGSVRITTETLTQALHQLKKSLTEQGEATDFFAREKESGNFAGIV